MAVHKERKKKIKTASDLERARMTGIQGKRSAVYLCCSNVCVKSHVALGGLACIQNLSSSIADSKHCPDG